MNQEIASFKSNWTWNLVDLPTSYSTMTTEWFYKIKNDPNDIKTFLPIKYKRHLVTWGFEQQEGIDYQYIFLLVVSWTIICTMVALAAHHNSPTIHMDVKSAFLNANMEEDIYIEQPQGFSKRSQKLVCKLHETLFDLKQSL